MKPLALLLILCAEAGAQSWLQLPSFPGLSRDDGVAVTLGNKAYCGSGLTSGWTYGADFYSFDLSSQSWTAIAPMPAGTERQYACAFAGGNGFFVFGGDGIGGTLNSLYEYHVLNNTWTQKASKPGGGIFGASCFVFRDSVIIAGGRFSGNVVSNEVWLYRISSNSWQNLNNMPGQFGGRWRAAYTVVSGKGYMLFGLDGNMAWRTELLEYDPRFDSWGKIMDVQQFPSLAYASMQSIGSSILLFGGVDSLNQYADTMRYFELSSQKWFKGPVFPSTPRRGGMSWVYQNRYYYTCGLDENEQRRDETWTLDIITGLSEEWKNTAVSLAPNPFSDEIRLFTSGSYTIRVTDLMGTLMIEKDVMSGENVSLDTKHWKPGFYHIQVQNRQGERFMKKLLKS